MLNVVGQSGQGSSQMSSATTTHAACLRNNFKQVQPVNSHEVFIDNVQSILGTGKDSPHPLSGIDKTLAAVKKSVVQKFQLRVVYSKRCLFSVP